MDPIIITTTQTITYSTAYTLAGGSHFLVEQSATWGDIYIGSALLFLALVLVINKLSDRGSD